MANDDANKSSNLKVPPLRIVINSGGNNSNTNSSATNNSAYSSSSSSSSNGNSANGDLAVGSVTEDVNSHTNDKGLTDSSLGSTKKGSNNSNLVSSNSSSRDSTSDLKSPKDSDSKSASDSSSSSSSSVTNHIDNNSGTSATNNAAATHSPTATSDTNQGDSHGDGTASSSNSSSSSTSSNQTNNCNGVKYNYHSPDQPNKDQHLSSSSSSSNSATVTQRITRSSQRAAQQTKSEPQSDQQQMTSADDQVSNSENIDKGNEQSRKIKKRKGDTSDNDQELSASPASSSTSQQAPIVFKPPAQNSFQLYKNIRMQVDRRLRNLNCVHPRTPHGFKDYLLNRGAYLLEGGRQQLPAANIRASSAHFAARPTLSIGEPSDKRMKNHHYQSSSTSTSSININNNNNRGLSSHKYGSALSSASSTLLSMPQIARVPDNLAIDSALHTLFVEQEKARHKMRMQHIKEREKLTLSAEQEILRVYNQAALAAANQLEPFSVCTLLKHEEIYNYIEPTVATINNSTPSAAATDDPLARSSRQQPPASGGDTTSASSNQQAQAETKDQSSKSSSTSLITPSTTDEAAGSTAGPSDKTVAVPGNASDAPKNGAPDNAPAEAPANSGPGAGGSGNGTETAQDQVLSDAERESYNKKIFLGRLQDIDDKWEKIKAQMLARHVNEADSLHAFQKLEWEWRCKETGACDLWTTPTIEPVHVPKVDVISMNY